MLLPDVRSDEATETSLATASQAGLEGLDAASSQSVLSEYARDPPESVVTALRRNSEWAKEEGRDVLNPPGVLSVMVFAAVARASSGGRVNWLISVNWGRVAGVFPGLAAVPPPEKNRLEPGQSHLGQARSQVRSVGKF